MKTFFQKIFPHLLKGKVAVNCPLSDLMTVEARAFSYSSNHSLTLHALWMGFWKTQVPSASRPFIKRWSRWRTFHLLSVPHHLRGQVNPKQPLNHCIHDPPDLTEGFSTQVFYLICFPIDQIWQKKPEVKKEQAASQLLFNTVFHSTQMWNNTHRVWFLNAHYLII